MGSEHSYKNKARWQPQLNFVCVLPSILVNGARTASRLKRLLAILEGHGSEPKCNFCVQIIIKLFL